jgi:putative heme-binding domain-containing protein
MDETDSPQTPAELLIILAALSDQHVPIQTIAPKFTGRFNKGVDYVGDVAQFEKEFNDDLAVIAHAIKHFGLPETLKLSVHSGSDKFSIYPAIRRALQRSGAGLHVKTAGTNWLEELIGLAEAGGDAEKGRQLFATRCLTCHQQGGQGGRVGPVLDGVGVTGIEAILRNVLTPNAAMEGGYRSFRVVTKDGRIVQGLLVSRDANAIVIRQPNTADIQIPAREVAQADSMSISIMPEGLLESLEPNEVSDLFAYLTSLTAKP